MFTELRISQRKHIDGEPRISKKGKPKRYSTSRAERTPRMVVVGLYRAAKLAWRSLTDRGASSVKRTSKRKAPQ